MFWVGDSHWGWKYNLKKLPNEITNGLKDNIPFCCVIVYLICILFSLMTKKDGIIFEFVYRDSNDFIKNDYWRCPLCKLRGKINKVKWEKKD